MQNKIRKNGEAAHAPKGTESENQAAQKGASGVVNPVPARSEAVEEYPAVKTPAASGTKVSDVAGQPYFTVDIKAKCAAVVNGPRNEAMSSDAHQKLYQVQGRAIDLLLKSYNAMIELSAVRLECKLSSMRVSGVARELRELIKVMSVYDC